MSNKYVGSANNNPTFDKLYKALDEAVDLLIRASEERNFSFFMESDLLKQKVQSRKQKTAAWTGGIACGKKIKRMPYHKENKPICRNPKVEGKKYCKMHLKEQGE